MSKQPTALGVHVFAGGLTLGLSRHLKVAAQFEIFDLGVKTVDHNFPSVDVWQVANREELVEYTKRYEGVDLVFGNPRCSAFSIMNARLDSHAYGPHAKQCADIHDWLAVVQSLRPRVALFESVTSLYTTGAELVTLLKEQLGATGYKFVELYQAAATFGNPQRRFRCYFIAYDPARVAPLNFYVPNEVDVPLTPWVTVWNVIADLEGIPAVASEDPRAKEADDLSESRTGYVEGSFGAVFNHAYKLRDDRATVLRYLAPGYAVDHLSEERLRKSRFFADKIDRGASLGLHAGIPRRLRPHYKCPTIASMSSQWVHPTLDRFVTGREHARLMGFPDDFKFVGKNTVVAQVGKGVVVQVAEWLGQQLRDNFTHPIFSDFVAHRPERKSLGVTVIHLNGDDIPLTRVFDYRGVMPNADHFVKDYEPF